MNRALSLRSVFISLPVLLPFILTASARAQDHGHPDGCIVGEQPVDPAIVARMRKVVREKEPADVLALPAPTVGSVVGKTVAAVFYLEIDEGGNLGPYWTPVQQQQVRENVRRNCDWWEKIAAHYGRVAEIEIQEFGPEHPASLLHWDPTLTTSPGDMIKDRSFHDTVMNRLGYTLGNSSEKMTAFCQDVAASGGADQAFIVWLIVGKNAVRSNASFNGPSTNVWYKSAQTGWTTAHEMGHIFGAFDEYYEEGTEYGRSRQSRNGAPNGNLAYRNHPIVPCMMSNSHTEGICSYTAVHIGLTDAVRFTQVNTATPFGMFEVRYWNPELGSTGGFGNASTRYQGTTRFPCGAGMRVRMTGLEDVPADDFSLLVQPEWDGTDGSVIDYEADTVDPGSLTLRYSPGGALGDYGVEYLSSDEGAMGAYVYGILPLGERRAAIASRDGICIYDRAPEMGDSSRIVLDYPFANSRDGSPRRGYSVALGPDSALWFGTQNSDLVRWKDDSTSRRVGPLAGQEYRALAITPDGDVWAGCEAGLHRFHGGSDAQITTYISARDPLIGETVWCLAVDAAGGVWIASRGRRDQGAGGGGLQRFDPATDTWTDHTADVGGATVNSIAVWGDTIAVATADGFAIFDGAAWRRYEPGNDFHKNVMAVAADAEGRLMLATFGGLYRMIVEGVWESYTVDNSLMPQNLCTSVALGPDGTAWVGTIDGTIALVSFNDRSSSVIESFALLNGIVLDVVPNPARAGASAILTLEKEEPITLVLYDRLGRERIRLPKGMMESGTHSLEIPTDHLESGVYWLTLKTERGTVSRSVAVE